jgi:hypothetical protein
MRSRALYDEHPMRTSTSSRPNVSRDAHVSRDAQASGLKCATHRNVCHSSTRGLAPVRLLLGHKCQESA